MTWHDEVPELEELRRRKPISSRIEGPDAAGSRQPTGEAPRQGPGWVSRVAGNQHVQRLLQRVRGQGKPLDTAVRRALEPMFGQSLGRVRIHDEPDAQSAALEAGAKAVTHGADVYFGPGRYDPASSEGQQLIAHEVTHVVQQTGAGMATGRTSTAPEGEAERAAETIQRGGPLDFAISTAQPAPALSPGAWKDDVRAANALTDPKAKAQAQLALIQRALGSGITVRLAGNSSPAQVDPADYVAAPVLNFDPNLNAKQSWPAKKGAKTRSLSTNYGYTFSRGTDSYPIIGPAAIDEKSEIFTKMYANHELYHVAHHTAAMTTAGGQTSDDQELETWTHDFVGYFHQLRHYHPQWAPLIGYYETATASAQSIALTALADYYKNPPVPAAEVANVKAAYEHWLQRRLADRGTMRLVKDLSTKLGITAKP